MFSRVEHYPHPSRHDPEPEPLYRWVVRAKQADGEFGEAVAAAPPNIQSMAVNAALQCVRGQLVALGGENRVSRSVANATALPLQWSSPVVAFTGDKAQTGCVEARARDSCEYDGKLSSVRLRGRTLVFTRSNLNSTGGRHVQVTRSTDGARGWSRFEQIRLAGYATRAHNNIYFWTARSVGGGKGVGRLLLATFPAVIEGKGGVYASVSHDGVQWAEPLRLMPSAVLPAWRTTDHPVDGDGGGTTNRGTGGRDREDQVSVTIEHDVAIPTDAESDERPFVRAQDYCKASALPAFCAHSFVWSAERLNATHVQVRLGELRPWVIAARRVPV